MRSQQPHAFVMPATPLREQQQPLIGAHQQIRIDIQLIGAHQQIRIDIQNDDHQILLGRVSVCSRV
jgi:hypothetical protein